jgi:uncharacterized protein
MSKSLLIVFVKNIKLGKVKTRLAKTIGTEGAFQVYKHLVEITENATNQISIEKHIYFSDAVIEEKWQKTSKFAQKGVHLGEKMQNSFKKGLKDDFSKIVLIGSDLPDISPEIIQKGFDELENHEVVFGPAEDGGYYLVGMKKPHFCIFENKKWSTENLLEETINELDEKGVSYSLLETLNDVDTIDDLKNSSIASKFENLIKPYL